MHQMQESLSGDINAIYLRQVSVTCMLSVCYVHSERLSNLDAHLWDHAALAVHLTDVSTHWLVQANHRCTTL